MNQEATADSLLVSINGTSQNPDTAYSVSGTNITFTETPLTTDIIDVRFLAVAVAAAGLDDILEDTSPQLGGNLDVNSKYITSVSNGNVEVKADGTGEIHLEGNVISLTGNVEISATTGTPGDTSTPAAWLKVYVGGAEYFLPLHQ